MYVWNIAMSNENEKILGYKIRHSKTKLYLSSVSKKKWTKVGKTWPRRGDAIRAINQGMNYFSRYRSFKEKDREDIIDDLANWEVVELTESSTYPVLFLIDKIKVGV